MSPRQTSTAPTITCVLSEFAEERRSTLDPEEHRAYCCILFFLELCINNYGHRNLDGEERAFCEKHYHASGVAQRHFFEVFGPSKLLPELDFFASVYVKETSLLLKESKKRRHWSSRISGGWLVERGYVTRVELDASSEVASWRTKLRTRAKRAARLLAERAVSVDPVLFTDHDYIDTDDHPITRVDPGRFWLTVYRAAEPEEIGLLLAPLAATKSLRVGWNLCCALARVRGRWQIVGEDEVYPK